MKKLLMALFTVALCAGFAACSSNDDNEPSIADKVVGVYIGQTAASFQYSPTPDLTDGDSIIVKKATDNTVNIEYRGKKWGKGTFKNVRVTETNDAYTFAETASTMAIASPRQPQVSKDYPANIKGTTNKTNKNNFSFNITVSGIMGGVKIAFTPKAN